jgi:hypothetical protein
MENVATITMTPNEAAQLNEIIEQFNKSFDEANERMDRYEAERLKLKAETEEILDRIRRHLNVEVSS